MNIAPTVLLILLSQVAIWFSTNSQLVDGWDKSKALYLNIFLAIPISLLTFHATKYGFSSMGSLWSVRLLAFGLSYLSFPVLTWVFLGESPFNPRTMICIILSMIIILIQLFVPNT